MQQAGYKLAEVVYSTQGADAGAQAQQQAHVAREVQCDEGPVQPIRGLDRLGRGQHRGGRGGDQQHDGDEPAEAEARRAPPQAAEAQVDERRAQAGQEVVEAQELQLDRHKGETPEDAAHGNAPGLRLLRGAGRQAARRLGEEDIVFTLAHSSSPPNWARSFFLMR